ncbi:MAG TPA: sigma-70 family RNA polymerase sigma factor [Gemmataceae bacterium]
MANARQHPILHYLRRVLGEASSGGVSDADLLRRFVNERDEAAFELLLWRHAAMVLHVCRQVLSDADAAEDAFQATFLVFVRKARSIGRGEALASWLYRVAYRIALKARAQVKTRTVTSEELDGIAAAEVVDADERELRRIICEEVNGLPEHYRAAVVACFFEGKTHEEAAKQLGWPRGTVAGRVARARELLRHRLLRRGVTLTMGALVASLTVRTAQAALSGLVDSVIHTARLLATGQTTVAVVLPHVAALAEGVLQTMYWTKAKIAVIVLFLASLGGAGVTLLATQEQNQVATPRNAMLASTQPWSQPVADMAESEPVQVSQVDKDDEPAVDPPAEENPPQDVAKLKAEMVQSRLKLKRLAAAMQNYAATYEGRLPLAASVGKDGRALLSWRVELLPFLGENDLYNEFKRDEPWDSPHNRKLITKMPAVFAPPGVKTSRPHSTYYQVFVSAAPSADVAGAPGGAGMPGAAGPGIGPKPMMQGMQGGGMAQMMGGMRGGPPQGNAPAGGPGKMTKPGASPGPMGGGGPPGMGGPPGGAGMPGLPGGPAGGPGMMPPGAIFPPAGTVPAFVKGETTMFPASFVDGTSNIILIIEAGNPVPWTKPEDLRYADDEPLPELGGLFPNVIHAAFADGSVHTLTKNYNKKQLRLAITINDGMQMDVSRIEANSRPVGRAGRDQASFDSWQLKNDELRKELRIARQQIQLLKEEQEVERELAGEDPRVTKLKEEHTRMQSELKKLREEIDALKKDIHQPRNR